MNMMTMKSRLPASIFDTLPEVFRTHTLGLDNWPGFEVAQPTYPPHNIVRTGEHTARLEFALAGFKPDDVSVTVQDGMLIVAAEKKEEMLEEGESYVHKGISTKAFRKSIRLFDYEIKGAEFLDGMLLVNLEHVVPEEKKPRKIEVKRK
jgi:molecular chaperone IbpA